MLKKDKIIILLFFITIAIICIANILFYYFFARSVQYAYTATIFIAMVELLFKFILCVSIPVFFIKHTLNKEPLGYLKLTTPYKKSIGLGLLISLGYLVGISLVALFHTHQISFMLSTNTWINGILFVGLFEEILFRGFLLQTFLSFTSPLLSTLYTSFIFVLLHIPYSPLNALFPLFFLSILLSYIYLKTNSLWGSVIVHSVNNFVFYIM